MLARRIIAVSPSPAFGEQLAEALSVLGEPVEVHREAATLGPGDLRAALCVIHVNDERADVARALVPRLAGDCRVIVVLPRSNLAVLVELMQGSTRVVGMMAEEDFDAQALSATARKALTGDVFGLDKVMPGVELHARVVEDYQDKTACMAQIAALIERAGVPRKHHASIEQCVDEMVMNALYDAPVDPHGKPTFADTPTRTRIGLRTDQTVAVQYAHGGRWFAVAVRDAFGSLTRQTVLDVLHKCLHAEQQIDRKVSGAGVGLYLMVSSSSAVSFHVVPGVATEVVCMFDLQARKLALAQLGFFLEPVDVTGAFAAATAAQPSVGKSRAVDPRRLPIAPGSGRRRLVVLAAAAAAALAVIGIAAWRWRGAAGPAPDLDPAPVAARPAQPPGATVELNSQPTGAAIEVDGTPMGSTPVSLTSLVPGAQVSIVFKRPGYRDATAHLKVPAAGAQLHLLQPLERSEDVVRIHLVSTPPGAQVLRDGQPPAGADRTYTPADVFALPGKELRFTLVMPGHVPLVIAPFTPARGDRVLEKGGALVEGGPPP